MGRVACCSCRNGVMLTCSLVVLVRNRPQLVHIGFSRCDCGYAVGYPVLFRNSRGEIAWNRKGGLPQVGGSKMESDFKVPVAVVRNSPVRERMDSVGGRDRLVRRSGRLSQVAAGPRLLLKFSQRTYSSSIVPIQSISRHVWNSTASVRVQTGDLNFPVAQNGDG